MNACSYSEALRFSQVLRRACCRLISRRQGVASAPEHLDHAIWMHGQHRSQQRAAPNSAHAVSHMAREVAVEGHPSPKKAGPEHFARASLLPSRLLLLHGNQACHLWH